MGKWYWRYDLFIIILTFQTMISSKQLAFLTRLASKLTFIFKFFRRKSCVSF